MGPSSIHLHGSGALLWCQGIRCCCLLRHDQGLGHDSWETREGPLEFSSWSWGYPNMVPVGLYECHVCLSVLGHLLSSLIPFLWFVKVRYTIPEKGYLSLYSWLVTFPELDHSHLIVVILGPVTNSMKWSMYSSTESLPWYQPVPLSQVRAESCSIFGQNCSMKSVLKAFQSE